MSTRPSKDHFLVLYLQVKDDKPQLIWLLCETDEDPNITDEDEDEPDYSDYDLYPEGPPDQFPRKFEGIFATSAPPRHEEIHQSLQLGDEMPDSVYDCYRDDFLCGGYEPNRSIQKLTPANLVQHQD
jgi:hypothetical protein